ncbi:MAG: hypothetical protein WBD22_11305 [Pyrinomonadaceae bacterium]
MTEKDKANSIWLSPLVLDGGVAVQFRDDHVHVQLGKGLKVSSEQRVELWGVIGRMCTEHGCRRVLVEGRAPKGVFQTSEVVDAGLRPRRCRSCGWPCASMTFSRMN